MKNYKHLVKSDSGFSTLSKTSEYYTQIQGQMAIVGVEYCDFFVYTAKGHHIERICFDPTFWENVQNNLIQFWMEYLSEELIYGSLSNSEVLDNSLTDHIYSTDEMAPKRQRSTAQLKFKGFVSKGPLSKPKLPLVYLCGKCAGVIEVNPDTEQQESVECSQCQLWFHRHCARLTDLSTVSGKKKWMCFKCQ